MKVKEKVSVIIPFFNAETFLERAIQSVILQTYSPVEIILVNDGSTDTSLQIAQKYCTEHADCHLISSKNKGPGPARNIGVKNATGLFLCFLDADDALRKDALEVLVSTMQKNSCDMVVAGYTLYGKNFEILKISTQSISQNILADIAIEQVIQQKIIPTAWGKLYKTAIAKQNFFPNIRWKEDDLFVLKYLKASNQVTCISESLVNIFSRKESLTRQTFSLEMIMDISHSFCEQVLELENIWNKELRKSFFNNKIRTYFSLFLVLQIDWKSIVARKKLLNFFQDEITILHIDSLAASVGLKMKVLLLLMKMPKWFGWCFSFWIARFLKRKDFVQLKKIKG